MSRFQSRSNRILALSGLALIASLFTLNSWLLLTSLVLFVVIVSYNIYKLMSNNNKKDTVIIVACIGLILVVLQLAVMFYTINKETPLIEIIKSFSINSLMIYVATEVVIDSIKHISKTLLIHKGIEKE